MSVSLLFGYIKCYPPELRLREYEYYRGVYCGLCRSMGRCTGCVSRLTLSYDLVFLALARMALTGENPKIKAGRCFVHPFRRRPVCVPCSSVDYAACAGAILGYYKLEDDLNDTRGIGKAKLLILRPALSHAKSLAEKSFGEIEGLDSAVSVKMSCIRELEQKDNITADELADLSGGILADVFECGLSGSAARISREIGYHVGRWVYLIDAVDDYNKDMRSGDFSPFRDSGLPSDGAICAALTSEMAATETAVGLLPDDCGAEISELIKNILYLGTERVTGGVLSRKNGKITKKHKKFQSYG